MLSILISGVVAGAMYCLASVSLVIVYKASRLINFALGGLGGLAAYLAYQATSTGSPMYVGYLIAVASGAAMGWATEFFLIRRVAQADHIIAGTGTLGALLIFEGICLVGWGSVNKTIPEVFGSIQPLSLGSARIFANQIYVVAVTLLVLLLMYLLLHRSRTGLRMRAVAESPLNASVLGVNVRKTSSFSWTVGGAVGGLAALLVIPTTTLEADAFTSFLFFGFAAVVLGGLTSVLGVAVGGFLFGVALSLIEYYLTSNLTNTICLVLVTALLLARPDGILGRRDHIVPPVAGLSPTGYHSPLLRLRAALASRAATGYRGLRAAQALSAEPENARDARISWAVVWVAGIVVVCVLPLVVHGGLLVALPAFSATILGVYGLSVLYGVAGKVSVGNGAFLAVGAYGTSILITHSGLPFFAAMVIASALSFALGILMAVPALKVRSYVYFSIITFMFANAVPELIDYFSHWTGGENGTVLMLPGFIGLDPVRQYWFCLAITVIVGGAGLAMVRSHFGRRWRAAKDSSAGAQSVGVNVSTATILAFGVSGALTGISGTLQAAVTGIVSPASYSIWVSIYILAGVVVGGAGLMSGSIFGAAFITFIPYVTGQANTSPDIAFGIIILIVVILAPGGILRLIVSALAKALLWVTARGRQSAREPAAQVYEQRGKTGTPTGLTRSPSAVGHPGVLDPAADGTRHQPEHAGETPLLGVRGLTVAYGDFIAVRDVTFSVEAGTVLALVGPNGAGKSSVLRGIAGVARLTSGAVVLGGAEVQRLRPWQISARGVSSVTEGRGMLGGLTVHENLVLGGLGVSKTRQAHNLDRVFTLFPDLGRRRHQFAQSLSGGQQQMLAIGRALMSEPKLLALDEPSLGLSPLLASDVYDSLQTMKRDGITMLVIEQNTALAFELADRVCILRDGKIQLTCSVTEAQSRPGLVSEYLGVSVTSAREVQ